MPDQSPALIPERETELAVETWDFDDYRHGLCRHGQIGTPRLDALAVKRMARQHAGAAIQTLVAIASQTKDLNAAYRAANALLDRGFGRIEATEATPPGQTPAPGDWPEWMTAERLAYKLDQPDPEDAPTEPWEGVDPLRPSPPPSPAPTTAPARLVGPAKPTLHAVPPSEPRFWDAPTRPSA